MIETSPALKGIAAHLRKDPRIGKGRGVPVSISVLKTAASAGGALVADEQSPFSPFQMRLRYLIKAVGGTAAASKILKKSVATVERYKAGAEISFKGACKLTDAAGFTTEWLATGRMIPETIPALLEGVPFEKNSAVWDESAAAIMAALSAAMFFAKDEETAIKGLTHALIDLAPANAVVTALFFIAHWTAEGGAE